MKPFLFTVGNFNLRNLAIPNFEYYPDCSYSLGDYQAKIQWCSQQLQRMNADIVSFQEVFHYEAIEELYRSSGIYPDAHLIAPIVNEAKPNVALISRLPVESWESIRNFPEDCCTAEISEFRRPPLHVILKLPDARRLHILAVHLKSKRPLFLEGEDHNDLITIAQATARSLRIRAAEAVAIRRLLMDWLSEPLIIAGDLNDSSGAVTTQIITGPRPRFSASPEQKKQTWRARFHCASDELIRQSLRDVTYTQIHDGNYENIDHVLVSDHFSQKNPHSIGQIVYMQFLNDHLIDRSQPWVRPSVAISDHGQLVTTVMMNPEGQR